MKSINWAAKEQERRDRASHNYVETITHRRFFADGYLYIAALAGEAKQWDDGKPEWMRNVSDTIQYGGV